MKSFHSHARSVPSFAVGALVVIATIGQNVTAFVPSTRIHARSRPLFTSPSCLGVAAVDSTGLERSDIKSMIETPKKSRNHVELLHDKREDLKRRLLEAADKHKAIQENFRETVSATAQKIGKDQGEKTKEKGYVLRLFQKIVDKITRGKKNKGEEKMNKAKGILGSEAFGTVMLEVGEAGNCTIALAEELAKLNPIQRPTYGFGGYGGGSPSKDCKLGGKWKLRFTTAADATFPDSPTRGKASTSQEIDPSEGTFTNVVDFEKGKLKGFRVVVAGEATSDTEIYLTFRKVVILRDSRFPRLFGRLVFPIPTKLLRALNKYFSKGGSSPRGPYFQLQYLDEDLRMHKTGEGNWFIQSRVD